MSDPVPRDFEAAYQGEPPPWDIGSPQPEVVRLAEEGASRGVAGCFDGKSHR